MDLEQAKRVIRSSGWLAETPLDFQKAVLARVVLDKVQRGERIQSARDQRYAMIGVADGQVRVHMAACDHGPYVAHVLHPGTWFGEVPAIVGAPRVLTMEASRPGVLLRLSRRDVQAIVEARPAWWPLFTLSLVRHFAEATEAIADLMLRDQQSRIIAVLLRLAGCRRPGTGTPLPLEVDVSQDELGQMANVARTTCGAVLRRLGLQGLLVPDYRRVVVLQPDRLRAMISDGTA